MKALLLALGCLCSLTALAQNGTLTVRAYCRSLCLYPTTTASGGVFNLNFTSHDAKHNLPLFVPAVGSDPVIVSSELRQRPNSAIYTTTYCFWQNGFVVRDGILSLTLSAADANRNRIRDLTEPGVTFYRGVKGRSRELWPGTNMMQFEARFSRAANQSMGAYSGFLLGQNTKHTFTGELGLMHLEGSANYQRGSTNVLYLSLDRFGKGGAKTTLTNFTTYRATRNVVLLAPTRLVDEFGQTYTLRQTALSRVGNRYIGQAMFLDGDLETPWPDYREWTLELIDDTDLDGNDVPDLSDPMAVPDDRAPVVGFTLPAARTARVTRFPITLRGTASDRSEIQTVDYRIENSGIVVATGQAIGTTGWSIPVDRLLRGTNTVWVSATDSLGNISGEVWRNLIYIGE